MSIQTSQQGGVLRLTLDRPEKSNAFDDQVILDLTEAFLRAAAEPSVRVVVLAASGKYFSAGGDLGWMQRMAGYSDAENLADAKALARLMQAIDLCPKPVLARVQGSAFAGAVGLLACCDIVVSVPSAQFAITEVRLGLIPAVISPYVVRAIGIRQARRWCLTAERFSAEQAKALGLVHEIAEENELDAVLQSEITALLMAAPSSLAEAKSLLALVDQPLSEQVIDETAHRIARQRASAEGREGVTAFLEKRTPSWRSGS
ncbi:MAG TPA: enoyl-CoA hydratase/isomerase family protein [Magnetospirillaceae bacterium]|nr:enoyl-CoA hydratase/isomerase family protein [Magnetospirillaceae bacterium]